MNLTTDLHAGVKNEWSYACAPHICLHNVDRGNFIIIVVVVVVVVVDLKLVLLSLLK